jgi:MFS family permease
LLIKGTDDFEQAPFNFTFKQVCLTFAVIGLLVAIVQGGIVRRLAKVVSEQHLAVAGALIEVVGFGLIAYAVSIESVRWLFGSLAVIVAGYSCLQPSLYSLLSRWSDPTQQGKILGVGQSVSALARIFGSALGIPMLKAYLFLPYAVGSVMMIAVAIVVTMACRRGRDFEVK